MIPRHHRWLWAGATVWILLTASTVLDALDLIPTVPARAHHLALGGAIALAVIAVANHCLNVIQQMHKEATEPVVTAFKHGYQLRHEQCQERCADRTAKVIPLFPPLQRQPEPVAPAAGGYVDPDATTVVLPSVPIRTSRPRPRPFRR